MRRAITATALSCVLLAGTSGTARAVVSSHCQPTIHGQSDSGGCSFTCYLTAIVFYNDGSGNIQVECDYGDCDTDCV
jgi:hypothetical protein